jgi:hypothetical protein
MFTYIGEGSEFENFEERISCKYQLQVWLCLQENTYISLTADVASGSWDQTKQENTFFGRISGFILK